MIRAQKLSVALPRPMVRERCATPLPVAQDTVDDGRQPDLALLAGGGVLLAPLCGRPAAQVCAVGAAAGQGNQLWAVTISPCSIVLGQLLGDQPVCPACQEGSFQCYARCRNVTDDPKLLDRLTPNDGVSSPSRRPPMCLALLEGTRLCVIRADNDAVMRERIFPALRALGRDLTRDVFLWNIGWVHAPALCLLCAGPAAAELRSTVWGLSTCT